LKVKNVNSVKLMEMTFSIKQEKTLIVKVCSMLNKWFDPGFNLVSNHIRKAIIDLI